MNQLFRLLLHSRRTPRVIDRRTHAALDYLTTAYFFCIAGMYWGRHRRAAATALINGMAVLGASMFTDYPGSLRKLISFETHGKIDIAQASMAAGLPALMGFASDAAAIPFHMQAGNEVMVVAATNWDEGSEEVAQQLPMAS